MKGPVSDRAEAEAAAWFSRLSRVSVSAGALREFQAWRRAPGNAAAYARVEAAWRAAGGLAGDPAIAQATAAALRGRDRRAGRPGRGAAAAGLAAAGAVAAAAAWFAFGAAPVWRTSVGEQRLVVLSDGSRVRLNTDSEVAVRYGRGARRLTLRRGQAFFEAAPDAARPFVVIAGGVRVTALGTRFDVRRAGEAVQVTLVEGQVAVALEESAQTARLAPDQQVTATARDLTRPRPADVAEAASWTTGRLTFRNVPLRTAVAEVNRYTARKVALDAPAALADAPVSGVFDVGDVGAFTAAVEAIFPLQARPEPAGGVRLSPAMEGG